uniref:Uncharacterized protein n=1 Tax=Anguilla anguilla TaxID=7936 RepID=A0A0E9QR74_ANGAN
MHCLRFSLHLNSLSYYEAWHVQRLGVSQYIPAASGWIRNEDKSEKSSNGLIQK